MIEYEVHQAFAGWRDAVETGETCGDLVARHTVQAVTIKAKDPACHIHYQVFYMNAGWSDPVADGLLCGTTGKSKTVHGIKIWQRPAATSAILTYRIYTDKWSDWHPEPFAILAPAGFSAIEIKIVDKDKHLAHYPSPPKTGEPIIDRLNALCFLRKAKTYLEIGVRDGHTFHMIHAPHKTGVDPVFTFDAAKYASQPGTHLFACDSDKFFADYATLTAGRYERPIQYDIVYIDGMHRFEFALRDFLNSLAHAHASTIWVFDDTVPRDVWSADADSMRIRKYRALIGSKHRHWHGDVFKIVPLLHDFYPMFSYATVFDSGNPQTVVWKTDQAACRPQIWGDLQAFKHLSYFDMLDNYQAFNPMPSENLLDAIDKIFNGTPMHNFTISDFIIGY